MDLSRFYFINNSLFEVLGPEDVAALKKFMRQKSYPKGKDVFTEGAYPKGVFFLDKGKVKIYQKSHEGLQQIMNIHVQGEIFGYRPLLCHQNYPVTATTIEDAKISFIPKDKFLAVLHGSPAFSNMLLEYLSYEFTVWVNTISNLAQRTVKERLLLNLLILIEKYRSKKTWPVEITLSRADLAALIGTSNETLARLIKILKDDRYISTKGRTIVINSSAQAAKIKKALLQFF